MADAYETEIIQGDTGPIWHIGVPTITTNGLASGYETLTDYSCTLVYTDSDGAEQTRTVTTTNDAEDRFLVQLTSLESDALPIGLSRIAVQIKDSAGPPYRSEVHIDLTVKAQRYQE